MQLQQQQLSNYYYYDYYYYYNYYYYYLGYACTDGVGSRSSSHFLLLTQLFLLSILSVATFWFKIVTACSRPLVHVEDRPNEAPSRKKNMMR